MSPNTFNKPLSSKRAWKLATIFSIMLLFIITLLGTVHQIQHEHKNQQIEAKLEYFNQLRAQDSINLVRFDSAVRVSDAKIKMQLRKHADSVNRHLSTIDLIIQKQHE